MLLRSLRFCLDGLSGRGLRLVLLGIGGFSRELAGFGSLQKGKVRHDDRTARRNQITAFHGRAGCYKVGNGLVFVFRLRCGGRFLECGETFLAVGIRCGARRLLLAG